MTEKRNEVEAEGEADLRTWPDQNAIANFLIFALVQLFRDASQVRTWNLSAGSTRHCGRRKASTSEVGSKNG